MGRLVVWVSFLISFSSIASTLPENIHGLWIATHEGEGCQIGETFEPSAFYQTDFTYNHQLLIGPETLIHHQEFIDPKNNERTLVIAQDHYLGPGMMFKNEYTEVLGAKAQDPYAQPAYELVYEVYEKAGLDFITVQYGDSPSCPEGIYQITYSRKVRGVASPLEIFYSAALKEILDVRKVRANLGNLDATPRFPSAYNPDWRTESLDTLLIVAAREGALDVVKHLVEEREAIKYSFNALGETACDVAKKRGKSEVADYLGSCVFE